MMTRGADLDPCFLQYLPWIWLTWSRLGPRWPWWSKHTRRGGPIWGEGGSHTLLGGPWPEPLLGGRGARVHLKIWKQVYFGRNSNYRNKTQLLIIWTDWCLDFSPNWEEIISPICQWLPAVRRDTWCNQNKRANFKSTEYFHCQILKSFTNTLFQAFKSSVVLYYHLCILCSQLVLLPTTPGVSCHWCISGLVSLLSNGHVVSLVSLVSVIGIQLFT